MAEVCRLHSMDLRKNVNQKNMQNKVNCQEVLHYLLMYINCFLKTTDPIMSYEGSLCMEGVNAD